MLTPKKKLNAVGVIGLFLVFVLLCFSGFSSAQRTGAWLDELIIVEEPEAASALTRLEHGEIFLYGSTLSDLEHYDMVRDIPEIEYVNSYGSYTELTFNPAGPVFEGSGELNPFAVPRIREAMNWLVDRNYIAEEIFAGQAIPKYTMLISAYPDYARLADVARELEIKYAHNPDRAEQVISEEMEKLGAERIDGIWHYEGEPVELIFLITADDTGDYVANLLEEIGFEVDRQYRTSAEASPIWMSSNPNEGLFHVYTGSWVTPFIKRDLTFELTFFHTDRGLARPLWQAYENSSEFEEITRTLDNREYDTIEERNELFARGLELSMEESVRIWLVDVASFTPHREEVSITGDLSSGISGSYVWPYNLRFNNREGGSMQIALPSVMNDPWNPIAGSNWIDCRTAIYATSDTPSLIDPYTGLSLPQRIKEADLFVEEGVTLEKTLDWVNVEHVEKNQVPEDAFIDWDHEEQKFISVGEKHPEGLTARRKVVVEFGDEFMKSQWHDGSPMSVADAVLPMILTFERANPESGLFDESAVGDFENFERTFRGFRIINEDPFTYEYYSETVELDAEGSASGAAWSLFPHYSYGSAPWHTMALAIKGEENEDMAFSSAKAEKIEAEWTGLLSGPCIEILEGYLEKARTENFIPYEPTLGQFVEQDQIRERWNNLSNWFDDKGHFWVSNGLYYVEGVHPVEGTLHFKRFEQHPDPSDKWAHLEEPMIADVHLSGSSFVFPADEAEFFANITFDNDPYPAELLREVRYLIFDEAGNLVLTGDFEHEENGTWKMTLSPETIAEELSEGGHRLEVVVASDAVGIPTFSSMEFMLLRD